MSRGNEFVRSTIWYISIPFAHTIAHLVDGRNNKPLVDNTLIASEYYYKAACS